MSIRILGGLAKGLELDAPKTSQIRPTSVMLKRRLFDSIQDFTGSIFIDLCSGTGSIAFEALSRGAEKVFCIDKNSSAINLLKKNQSKINKFKNQLGEINIVKSDAYSWLNNHFPSIDSDHLIYVFFDPPYEDIESYRNIYQLVSDKNSPTKLILEACSQKTMPLSKFETLFPNSVKTFKQGTSFFIIYDFK